MRNGHKNCASPESWHGKIADRLWPGKLRLSPQRALALSEPADYAAVRTQVCRCQGPRFDHGAGVARLSNTLSRSRMRGPPTFAVPSLRENRASCNSNGLIARGSPAMTRLL